MRIEPILFFTLLLTSCGYVSVPVLSPYKMDIRQGNYVTPEMREKLKPGMSKSQVRYVLGTPMVSDVFHGNRWDYAYSLEQRGEIVEKQRLTLYFEGDSLVRIDDGLKAAPVAVPPPVAVAASAPAPVSAPVPPPVAADPAADVLRSVQSWAAAWADKDVRGYLAAYLPDYKPQGMSRKAWEQQRGQRIGKSGKIEVELSEISVNMRDDRHASVSFAQRYRSDSYRDDTRKTLQLEKIGGAWLIASEQVIK